MKDNVVLEVSHLKKYFDLGHGRTLHAVDDVSFSIREGETLGLVGESGCGKTTCGRTCLGMYNKTDGQVLYRGKDVHALKGSELFAYKREAQMVFQDPYASLDPRHDRQRYHRRGHGCPPPVSKQGRARRENLRPAGKSGPEQGARQPLHPRVLRRPAPALGIARALAWQPKFLVMDEPISALDVSIQAQVINMLIRLQKEMGLTYLFVAHDLSMVKHISDRVAVMYLGQIVEITRSEELYSHPLHPYTQALLSAIPIPDPIIEAERETKRIHLEGEVTSPIDPAPGCRFASRCPYATARCKEATPTLKEVGTGHEVACFRVTGE